MNTVDSAAVGAKRPHAEIAYRIALSALERLTFKAIAQAASVRKDLSIDWEIDEAYVKKITSNILEQDQTHGREESHEGKVHTEATAQTNTKSHRTRPVAFTHPCAREFLEDNKGSFGNKYDAVENHTVLAELCVAALMAPDLYKKAPPTVSNPGNDDFYQYAVDNWYAHCEFGALGDDSHNVQDSLVWSFLDATDNLGFKTWVACSQHREQPSDTHSKQSWSSHNQAFAAASFGLKGVLQGIASGDSFKIQQRDEAKRNLLHVAAACDQFSIAEFLLGLGIEKDAKAYNNRTPLLLACEMNNIRIVELLLSAPDPVDSTKKDTSNRTCFHYACQHGDDTRLLKCLMDRADLVGAILRTTRFEDESAIEYAIYQECDEAISIMVTGITHAYEKALATYESVARKRDMSSTLRQSFQSLLDAKECMQHLDTCLRSALRHRDQRFLHILLETPLTAATVSMDDENMLHILARHHRKHSDSRRL